MTIEAAHIIAWLAFSFFITSMGVSVLYNGLVHKENPIKMELVKVEKNGNTQV